MRNSTIEKHIKSIEGIFYRAAVLLGLAVGSLISVAPASAGGVTRCDTLAASPSDPERNAPAVVLTKATAAEALAACREAVAKEPKNPRLFNQLIAAEIASGFNFQAISDEINKAGHEQGDYKTYPDTSYQFFNELRKVARPENVHWDILAGAAQSGHPGAIVELYWQGWIEAQDHQARRIFIPDSGEKVSSLNGFALLNAASHQQLDKAAAESATNAMNLSFLNGYPSHQISNLDHREIVSDIKKYPFSVIGRLSITTPHKVSTCTATIVGNMKTIVTAGHCIQPGATYTFAQGESLQELHSASLFAKGDEDPSLPVSLVANQQFDDWAILDLDQPLIGEGDPVLFATPKDIDGYIVNGFKQRYNVAGYPADLFSAGKMIYGKGCGINPALDNYKGSYLAQTQCPAYHGLSGASVLMTDVNGWQYMIGVVSLVKEQYLNTDTRIVLSKRLAAALCKKMAAEKSETQCPAGSY